MIIEILKYILLAFTFLFAVVGSIATIYDFLFNPKLRPDNNKVWKVMDWKFKRMKEKEEQ